MARVNTQDKHPIRLVDLAPHGFVLEPRYYFYGWANTPRMRARKSAVEALLDARSLLPAGFNFKIWDAHRPYEVQVAMLNSFRQRLTFMYPHHSQGYIKKLLIKFGGRPLKTVSRLDTHRNGGAFDLTIVDAAGNELYMGTDHDDLTPTAALDFFDRRKQLSVLEEVALKSRHLLKQVMTKAGFKPYRPEWCHWSCDK